MARLKPWAIIEPPLPEKQRRARRPGRKRLDDRLALQGVLFVRPRAPTVFSLIGATTTTSTESRSAAWVFAR